MEWLFNMPNWLLGLAMLVVGGFLGWSYSLTLDALRDRLLCDTTVDMRRWERFPSVDGTFLFRCSRCSFVGSYPQRHVKNAPWPPGIKDRIPEDTFLSRGAEEHEDER